MEITVQKVGVRDGKERFVLVDMNSGNQVSVADVSEPTLRRFLGERGYTDELIDKCLHKAREFFEEPPADAVAPDADDLEFEDAFDFDEDSGSAEN